MDNMGFRVEDAAEDTIDVCLLGDSQEREYEVVWRGTADFATWERENGEHCCGEIPAALVLGHQEEDDGSYQEYLVALHPDYEWSSAGNEFCRDFEAAPGYPIMTDERLNKIL